MMRRRSVPRGRLLLLLAVATALLVLTAAGVRSAAADTDPAIQSSLRAGVPLQQAVADDLPRTRPVLRRTRRLMIDLRPSLRALREAAPALRATLRQGTATARRWPAAGARLNDTLAATRRLVDDPVLPRSLNRQIEVIGLVRPVLRPFVVAQVEDQALTRLATNATGALAEGNAFGTWLRTLLVLDPPPTTTGSGR